MWRTEEHGTPIDASGKFVDGTDGGRAGEPARRCWCGIPDQYVRNVTEKLLTYALGRGVEYQDMPLVRKIVRDSAPSNYRFSSLVMGIVTSAPFQMNMKTDGAIGAARGPVRETDMFISKKHIPRRTFLRGAGVTLALPLLDAMVPAATAAGADGGDAEAAVLRRLRLPRRRARLLDSRDGEPDGRRAAVHLQAARALQEADRDLQRTAFAIGRAASGCDRRRPLGGGGVPVRQQAEEDGGRGCLGVQPDDRSAHRQEDRPGRRCCRRSS